MTEPVDILKLAADRLYHARRGFEAVNFMQYSTASERINELAKVELELATRDANRVRMLIAELSE